MLARERYAASQQQRADRIKRAREWCKANPEKARLHRKNWHLKNIGKRKAARLKNYGITQADFDWMLAFQENKCGICAKALDGRRKLHKPHVDHCHKTKKVRGLLCSNCNTGIGFLGEDPVILRRAAGYLLAAALDLNERPLEGA